jgi:hypothetical protein
MPTITIDLPDNLNVPSNWDVQLFLTTKMLEAGFLDSDQAVPSVVVESAVDDDADSWFTPEERAQFKENRRRLDEKYAQNPPPMTKEEFKQFLLNGPVADEETIQRQNEVREDMKKWTLRSW